MELIALTGAKGSGKNAAALGISQWSRGRGLHAAERGFADMLKWSVARLFWPEADREQGIAWANAVKQKGGGEHFEFQQVYVGPIERQIDVTISGRLLLQRYGTESHRDIFGEDFWVDQLLPAGDSMEVRRIKNFSDDTIYPDFAVITDLRFANEAQRVKDVGGVIWEIQRPGLDTSDSHPSEQPLPCEFIDKVILNDKTIAALIEEVEHAMDNDYHLKFLTQDPA